MSYGLFAFDDYSDGLRNIQAAYNLDKQQKIICSLGLSGEVGEVMELIKKELRDGTEIDRKNLVKELGDVLAYLTLIGEQYGISLEEIAKANLNKLNDRRIRGTLRGSGNDR